MRIRPVHPSEYEELVCIWEASVRETHDFLTPSDIQGLRAPLLEEWLPAVTLKACVSEEGLILGFSGLLSGKLEMLFLSPAARGQGAGRLLLEDAIVNLSVRSVDVNEQNEQAVGFYKHMGFEVFDRSPVDSQGKPFPLLHMRLSKG